MQHWKQGVSLLRNRKSRRDAVLRKMQAWRNAKERKRLANPPPEPEPKTERWFPLEIGVRDKRPNGYGEAWADFKSLRDAMRRLRVVMKYCQ